MLFRGVFHQGSPSLARCYASYKHADGKKIDGRRVLVDVERGRTVKGWHPRRLGGGLGGTRRGGADVNIKHSGRDDASRYDDRPIGGDRDRGERRDRSRDRDKERGERRRSRSRERRRRTRSRERERAIGAPVEEIPGSSRRRDRDRERGGGSSSGGAATAAAATGGSRERSRDRDRERDRKRRSRSRDRKRDRERGKGADGGEEGMSGLADGMIPEGERVVEESLGGERGEDGGPEGEERVRERDKDRDRKRSHRDKDRDRDRDRRRDRDRDREHKRDRGDRDRGDRREDRHVSSSGDQEGMGNGGEEGEEPVPPKSEEGSQDGMMMLDQDSMQSGEGYASNENGYRMESQGDEF